MGILDLDQTIKVFCFLAIGYFLASTAYQWNRLRHIPGPFLASFSYLWLGFGGWTGRQYDMQKVLGEEYGPLVRVGPNEVSTDDLDTIRRISSAKSTYPRSGWYDGTRIHSHSDSMFTMTDPGIHDKRKAQTTAGYSGRESPGVESAIEEQIENLISLIRRKYVRKPGASSFPPLDIGKTFSMFTLDTISRIALGKEFGCLEADKDVLGFSHIVELFLPFMNVLGDVPWARNIAFSKLGIRLFSPKPTDKRGIGKMMKMVNTEVHKRYIGDVEAWNDILGSFRRHGLTEVESQTEAFFMFMAGSETVASAMRITLFYLIATPTVYQRLKTEIKAAIESGRASSPITAAEAKQLPYLQAVLHEGLRVRPTATGTFSREVPPEGDTIHGHFLPGGTTISPNLSSLMRSKTIFGKDVDIFRPERFLEVDQEQREEMQRTVEHIFGYGRWMCAGKAIAWIELNKTLFEILRQFDFQIFNPQAGISARSHGSWVDNGVLVMAAESDMFA
ncbi:cytochrome P450 [Hypoxylon argillaceum]|nr:cytochrome P450 [Hypoxylon argillaceum]